MSTHSQYVDGDDTSLSLPAHGSRGLADRLGVWTSALCVVHCVLTPVVLSFSAMAAHLLPGEESTHRALAMLVALRWCPASAGTGDGPYWC